MLDLLSICNCEKCNNNWNKWFLLHDGSETKDSNCWVFNQFLVLLSAPGKECNRVKEVLKKNVIVTTYVNHDQNHETFNVVWDHTFCIFFLYFLANKYSYTRHFTRLVQHSSLWIVKVWGITAFTLAEVYCSISKVQSNSIWLLALWLIEQKI